MPSLPDQWSRSLMHAGFNLYTEKCTRFDPMREDFSAAYEIRNHLIGRVISVCE